MYCNSICNMKTSKLQWYKRNKILGHVLYRKIFHSRVVKLTPLLCFKSYHMTPQLLNFLEQHTSYTSLTHMITTSCNKTCSKLSYTPIANPSVRLWIPSPMMTIQATVLRLEELRSGAVWEWPWPDSGFTELSRVEEPGEQNLRFNNFIDTSMYLSLLRMYQFVITWCVAIPKCDKIQFYL